MRRREPALRWLAALCVLLLAGAAEAQTTASVAGTVVVASTGEPIAGAEVSVEGTSLATITTENGRFLLQNVPVGPQVVRVQSLGHAD